MRKISDILKEKFTISLEFFPPKDEKGDKQLWQTVDEIKQFRGGFTPDFYTVTFGAGGSSKAKTLETAKKLKELGYVIMEHFTCYGLPQEEIQRILNQLNENDIINILALRGDKPFNNSDFVYADDSLPYASDLVKYIRNSSDKFDISVAAYPEGHPDAGGLENDLKNFKIKVDAGADYAITQLFLDNEDYYRYIEKCRAMDINIPILPGMLPIISYNNITKFAEITGSKIPQEMINVINKHKDDSAYIREYGIEYAVKQIEGLKEFGIPGVHLYPLNRSYSSLKVLDAIL